MADVNMLPLIAYIREYGQAATDDVFNGVTYWTNDQLEDLLLFRGAYATVRLEPFTERIYTLDAYRHYWFSSDFVVYDDADSVVAGGTYDPLRGVVTYAADRSEDYLYMKGFVVNLYDALADLWEVKAQQRMDYVNFRAGHNVMNLVQTREYCENQRNYYRNRIVRKFKRG